MAQLHDDDDDDNDDDDDDDDVEEYLENHLHWCFAVPLIYISINGKIIESHYESHKLYSF